jgi:ABC-2 type transport system permease protein
MQYRFSFLMQSVGQFLFTGIEFAAIWALFDRFGGLRDWRLPEVALFYGMVHVAFALADAASRGFDMFGYMVRRGEFDRLLLRPRSTAFQLAAQDFQMKRIGRFTQALAVLIWAICALGVRWSLAKALLCAASMAGAACLFYGLIVLQATAAFWTVETLEIMNVVTYGGTETVQYPLAIYRRWLRRFFTFVVPLACVNYYPVLAILGRPAASPATAAMRWLSPAVGPLFLLAALRVWRLGVRHYRSTGS